MNQILSGKRHFKLFVSKSLFFYLKDTFKIQQYRDHTIIHFKYIYLLFKTINTGKGNHSGTISSVNFLYLYIYIKSSAFKAGSK